jgi:hypothetical protein
VLEVLAADTEGDRVADCAATPAAASGKKWVWFLTLKQRIDFDD